MDEENNQKVVYCGWCGCREKVIDGKYECPECDDYFINERN